MKRKSLIPILILSCAGATMCSRKNDPPPQGNPAPEPAAIRPDSSPAGKGTGKASGDYPSNLLGFNVGTRSYYLLKAADAKLSPKGKFLGKEEFRKEKAADKVLLLVLVPSQAKESKFTLEAGGKATPLAAPILISRMPNSPAHTYVIVDARAPGRLAVTAPDGTTGGIDLAGSLDALPHHWGAGEDGYLGYRHLPKELYGKLPH